MAKVLEEIFQPAVITGDKPADDSQFVWCERVNAFLIWCNAIGNKGSKSLSFRFFFFPPALHLTCRIWTLC